MPQAIVFKYSGAGNDFILADGRGYGSPVLSIQEIISLCDREKGFRASDGRVGADGVIILEESEKAPFRMNFFNPDGSTGMMCGNGGRCIVDFAAFLGISPASGKYVFEAPDGIHEAWILSREGQNSVVRLSMRDAFDLRRLNGGLFLNTGTRHFVKFVDDIEKVDVGKEGSRIRHSAEFAPEGTNVDFVEIRCDGSICVRTFEKGVEAETLACGTGIVASAIAASLRKGDAAGREVHTEVHSRISELSVDFIPVKDPAVVATGIFLTGPVERF